MSEIDEMVNLLKSVCDREWDGTETPIQIAAIAANAIHWRNREIQRLKDVIADALRDCREMGVMLEEMSKR